MFLYSTWMIAIANPARVDDLVAGLRTDDTVRQTDEVDGVIWLTPATFEKSIETPWLVSQGEERRWWGLAHMPADEGLEQVIGVVALSQAWVTTLGQQVRVALNDLGVDYEPAGFSLSTLLGHGGQEHGLVPQSVRLASDGLDLVVQSAEEALLRDRLAEITSGDITGVTFALGQGQVTALEDGIAVFGDDTTPTGVLSAMRVLKSALVTNALAG